MAYGFGNRTITDGLVFCLDAANPTSYQTNTSFWKSIAKDSSIGDFAGGTYYQDLYQKPAIIFDGADDFIAGQSGPDGLLDINKTGVITVQLFFSVSILQSKKSIFCASGDDSTNAHYGVGVSEASGDESIYVYIFNDSTEGTIDTNEKPDVGRFPYRMITVSFGTQTPVYFDTTYIGDHNITITGNPLGNYWFLATKPTKSEFFTGAIHGIRIYNRILSANEVSNNYQFYTQR
jgi:hypothetical protein